MNFFDRVASGDYKINNGNKWNPRRTEVIHTASGMIMLSWLTQEDLANLRRQKLIVVIKDFRVRTNCGLAEAKWAVESEWVHLVKNGLEGPRLKNYHDDVDYSVCDRNNKKISKSLDGQVILIEDRYYSLKEIEQK